MKIKIVCVGDVKEKFFSQAVDEYVKRLGRFCKAEVCETKEYAFKKEPSKGEIEKALAYEGADVISKLEGYCVCLDIKGQNLDSVELSKKIESVKNQFSTLTFVIGGSYGLSEEVKSKCHFSLSFGKTTFPHQLMRVILCEQIYRAFMISGGSTYHK